MRCVSFIQQRFAARRRLLVVSLFLLLQALSSAACQDAAAVDWVVPPGQEDLIADLLGKGVLFPGECRFSGGEVEGGAIHATYTCASGELAVELHHPNVRRWGVWRTNKFSVSLRAGSLPNGFAEALASHIHAREGAFRWKPIDGGEGPRRTPAAAGLSIATVFLGLALILSSAWERSGSGTMAVSLSYAALAAFRLAGLIAVVLLAQRGIPSPSGVPGIEDVVALGVVPLAGFLWLVVSGSFGYAGATRRDWVGLVPFAVALILREGFTLHSVQEVELQFLVRPVDKQGFVYPLLQMLFVPLVRDSHAFTMHMNAVLGSFACLAMYLFVRRRMESRAAGFLAALFLATHPLVTRFSPTDGTYAFLLAAWFSGLALLSARDIGSREIIGGSLLLGVAATCRVEGSLFLLASLLMLDPRRLIDAARRNVLAAAFAVSAGAAMVVLQMSLVLSLHASNAPPVPAIGLLVWPVWHGSVFAALVIAGAASGIFTGRWLGTLAFVSALIVTAPVAYSDFPTGLHRLVPACALHAMIAGIGAYSLPSWIFAHTRWSWLTVAAGSAAALFVLAQNREELTRPYVYTVEYDLVRRHLRPGGIVPPGCVLLSFSSVGDSALHDFAQAVPGMRVLDCRLTDCAAAARDGSCFYYVRSTICYFHGDEVPAACINGVDDLLSCLSEPCASLERSLELHPIELQVIDLQGLLQIVGFTYPPRGEIGLFRVHPRQSDPGG